MRRFRVIGFSLLLLPLLARAQSQFDGTWKLDANSVPPRRRPMSSCCKTGRSEERRVGKECA